MSPNPTPLAAKETTARRIIILVLLYSVPVFQAMLPVEDPDIWWHLRAGHWILSHGQVPTTDPFSAYGMDKSWIAYSWLFEVLVYGLFTKFGLSGVLWLTVLMTLLIAFTLHYAVRSAGLPFLAEVVLLAVVFGSLKPVISPRPWLFSILFFAIELYILFQVQKTGRLAAAFILPILFALWANLHIQFIYGLAVLLLFASQSLILTQLPSQLSDDNDKIIPFRRLSVLLLSCGLATLLTPYHFQLYRPIAEYSLQSGAFQNISELHPLFFRSIGDWLILALTICTAFVLGWRRAWLPFPLLLLLMGAFFAFRARRDAWVIVLAAAFIISKYQIFFTGTRSLFSLTGLRVAYVAVALVVAIFLIGRHRQLSEEGLQAIVARVFPADAVNFVRQSKYAGPLYNPLDWGGYLIWSLPEIPVSIDGRTNLHGDERIARTVATWAARGWDSDPELMSAQLIIAGRLWPLAAVLAIDPRFELVYQDATALVFISTGQARFTPQIK